MLAIVHSVIEGRMNKENNMVYINTKGHCSVIKKNEILSLAEKYDVGGH
jgi:hypothetical protein